MTRRHQPPPIVRYVYVIGPMDGLQKVGMAIDPKSRLAALQTASPAGLMVHAAIAVPFGAAPDGKQQAHRLLARSCVRNEWFQTTPAETVAAVLCGCPAMDGQAAIEPFPGSTGALVAVGVADRTGIEDGGPAPICRAA